MSETNEHIAQVNERREQREREARLERKVQLERERHEEMLGVARKEAFKCKKQIEKWHAEQLEREEQHAAQLERVEQQLEVVRAYVRAREEQLEAGRKRHCRLEREHAERHEKRREKRRGLEEWFAKELARARGHVEQLEREQVNECSAPREDLKLLEREYGEYEAYVAHLERTLD